MKECPSHREGHSYNTRELHCRYTTLCTMFTPFIFAHVRVYVCVMSVIRNYDEDVLTDKHGCTLTVHLHSRQLGI